MSTDLVDLITEHTDSLRRYLPAQLADPFIDQPTMAGARQCDAHLDALLHAVSTYLPRYLVRESLQDPVPGQVSGQFRQATIMFADISGFTAMSERLSRKGEQGAEMITNIVGAYFTTMLEVTGQHGGDLLKFGGDALLVAFLEEDHAIQACRAAAEMQRAIAQFSQVEAFGETFRLKMTVGLGSGLQTETVTPRIRCRSASRKFSRSPVKSRELPKLSPAPRTGMSRDPAAAGSAQSVTSKPTSV